MKKSYPIDKKDISKKFQAAGWHLCCSVLIFLLALAWIRWVLYPQFHFALNGVLYGLRLIAGVDLILGPLITLLIFHPLKPLREKLMDFAVVGLVQLAALIYGLHTMYLEHPRVLSLFQYGTAVTITQREWNEMDKPSADWGKLTEVGGVPIAIFKQSLNNKPTKLLPITLADLEQTDKVARHDMTYHDDKQALADLEKTHGKVYVFAVLGKYQGLFVALDAQQRLLGIFGQRDLH